jgi:hypothetical protein
VIEAWRRLLGYSDRYEVSNLGGVRTVNGRVLRPRKDTDGYLILDLWDYRRYYTVKVHHLILSAFVGLPPSVKHECDHINRQPSDNRVENLRWVTKAQNNRNRRVISASGFKGVRFRRGRPTPWQAYACVQGRFKNIGHFSTLPDAVNARMQFAREHGV